MTTIRDITPGASVRYIDEGRWRFGTVVRVRRGGRTVEVKIGGRTVLVHPERRRRREREVTS